MVRGGGDPTALGALPSRAAAPDLCSDGILGMVSPVTFAHQRPSFLLFISLCVCVMLYFLKSLFTLYRIGCIPRVIQHILEHILDPVVCTFHSPAYTGPSPHQLPLVPSLYL